MWKRLLACNPFYLVSAALLLFGFYRVSVDPNFLGKEVAQLAFNLSSLQCYEMLLVVTAIFLARRRVWYDATLLVGLENLLVLVPFILISQAALIDQHLVWALCLGAGVIAMGRFGGLKHWIAELNLPGRLINSGLSVLAVNVALPIAYRILHASKVGKQPTDGAAYFTNEYAWVLLLPALCALAMVIPSGRQGDDLPPQKRWLPLGLFSLWMAGTMAHLYCLGYIYDFDLRPALIAPVIWVLAWTLHLRLPEFLRVLPQWKQAFLVAPLLATFLAAPEPNSGYFQMLTLLNAGIYGGLCYFHRTNRLALHLLIISLVALVGSMPEEWGRCVVTEFNRAKFVGAAATAYLLISAALSRNPKLGCFGALVSATAVLALFGRHIGAPHWAMESGLVFLLLHSLRWRDAEQEGAGALRAMAALVWMAHALVWMRMGGPTWATCITGGAVLCAYGLSAWLRGGLSPRVLPIAAIIVMLSGPGEFTAGWLRTAPAGLLAVIGSFLLFGLGTLAAMTKHRWNKPDFRTTGRAQIRAFTVIM